MYMQQLRALISLALAACLSLLWIVCEVTLVPRYSESRMAEKRPVVEFNIEPTDFELQNHLGRGYYGDVYKGEWQERTVAIKKCITGFNDNLYEIEVTQLRRVQHENIIKFYGASFDETAKYIIMEYADGKSLHYLLHVRTEIDYDRWSNGLSWVLQCAQGVKYLHNMQPRSLLHRDLKPMNLLLKNKALQLKICDFGTVREIKTNMTNMRGSVQYMAPEVFGGTQYTERCDVFSWGITLWEILKRERPYSEYSGTQQILWAVHSGKRPPLCEDWDQRIRSLLTRCWSPNPADRPTMVEIIDIIRSLLENISINAIEY